MKVSWKSEVDSGTRFQFGKNWLKFLGLVGPERVEAASLSLVEMLGAGGVEGRTFIDAGCGSGLFSLSAILLGAAKVHSFDYDVQSVECTKEMKRRFAPQAGNWIIETGSILDAQYVKALGRWDVVYSWGVLHHTGNMWLACEAAGEIVSPNGRLFIGLYNDQGLKSRIWRKVKALFNKGPVGKALVLITFIPLLAGYGFAMDCLHLKNPLADFFSYDKKRGMSLFRDWIDWLGGYPFEVATPVQVKNFYASRGFELVSERLTSGFNQFIFRKIR